MTRFDVTLTPQDRPAARPWSRVVEAANRFDALRVALERYRAERRAGAAGACVGSVRERRTRARNDAP